MLTEGKRVKPKMMELLAQGGQGKFVRRRGIFYNPLFVNVVVVAKIEQYNRNK